MYNMVFQEEYLPIEKISVALRESFYRFNKYIGASFSEANVKVGYFTMDNFVEVFREFCKDDFPEWLREDYTNPSYCEDMQASAFVDGDKAGILINTSVPFSFFDWVRDLAHELAHIYAVQNEYEGRSFYDEHCDGGNIPVGEDVVYIGYAVWREFIADYIAAFTTPEVPRPSLDSCFLTIQEQNSIISGVGKRALRAVSMVLAAIFTCQDYMDAADKEEVWNILKAKKPVNLEEYGKLLSFIYNKVNNENIEPHVINEDFIGALGSLVLELVHNRMTFRRW